MQNNLLITQRNKQHYLMHYWLVCLSLLMLFLPDIALAQVPSLNTGNIGIPGVTGSSSLMKTFAMTIAFIVFIIVLAYFGFGMAETIGSFFRGINDARQTGEWGPTLRFFGLALVVIAIVFVIIGYINSNIITPANAIT